MKVRIPCLWQVYGVVQVEVVALDASSLAQAITQVVEQSPLPDGRYIDDSFEIDWGGIPYENAEIAWPDLARVRQLVEGRE